MKINASKLLALSQQSQSMVMPGEYVSMAINPPNPNTKSPSTAAELITALISILSLTLVKGLKPYGPYPFTNTSQ